MKATHLIASILLTTAVVKAQDGPPRIIAPDGTYLGNLSANPYDINSTANPYGPYGSPYSSTSINNPYSEYGSPYGAQSIHNPYISSPANSLPVPVEPVPLPPLPAIELPSISTPSLDFSR